MNDSFSRDPSVGMERDVYTVTEISEAVRQHLESEFPRVCVIGEIANLRVHTSGHRYFSLRDSDNVIRVVLFRRYAERIPFAPEDGALVIAPGRISHFGGSGQTQLIATELIPAGRGSMELEFRRLLARLMEEGLTSADRKRDVPPYPALVAIITSPTGAVIRDIVDTLARRWPVARTVHIPVDVQGHGAARSIVAAFETVNAMPDVDTVILARGGGSVEDLWTFNLEEVARAVAGSVHPVITGIGHEIDTTVADYVADVRAATPTAAAELATPRIEEVTRAVGDALNRIVLLGRSGLENRVHLVEFLVRSGAFPAIEHSMERAELGVDDGVDRLFAWWHERRRELEGALEASGSGLEEAARDGVERPGNRLRSLAGRLALSGPSKRLSLAAERIDRLSAVMRAHAAGALSLRGNELSGKRRALSALDPRGVLRRGYTVCTTAADGRIIPRVTGVARDSKMAVHFFDGEAFCTVTGKRRKPKPWHEK